MPNHLANQNSPYLLQHKDNPVEWYPWGSEALEKARAENKPIFLSIGYAACHWCHVMERESFEDIETAALMNEHFINIKVDREERPDLDGIYMSAVVALTGQGGWPMSVFLTPELQPFFGGTYFPPTPRYGMPSFSQVLTRIAALWAEKPDELIQSGQKLSEHIREQQAADLPAGQPLTGEALDSAAQELVHSYDWQHGGWGRAPKFPQPMSLIFLMRRAAQGDQQALQVSRHALDAMAQGGMHDLVGGGFARYSVDDHWLVPHFEKMLYDNAFLARAYLYAYLLTGEPHYRRITERTLDFVLREMTHPQGGFFSSIDADSEGEEGKFYLWSKVHLRSLLNDDEFSLLDQTHQLPEDGNFEGRLVLRRKNSEPLSPEEAAALDEIYRKLLAARSERARPATDDKILVAWNAWMSKTFAEAGRYLTRPDYLLAAANNLGFMMDSLVKGSRLMRSWREGQAQHSAYLEDHASLVLALLAMYQSDHNNRWFVEAERLTGQMLDLYCSQDGQFFDTAHDQPDLLLRPRQTQDNATPSGASLAAQALLQMSALTGDSAYRDHAERLLMPEQKLMAAYPTAFGSWLAGLDFAMGEVKEVALIGDLESALGHQLLQLLWSRFRPYLMLAASRFPVEKNAPALLHNRPLLDGKPTAYVCQNFTCQQPTSDPEVLRQQLS